MRNAPEFLAAAPVVTSGAAVRELTTREERVVEAVHEVLKPLSVRLEDVQIRETGSSRSLQILIDDAAATTVPLDLDRVADASRAISEALDATDAMGSEPYDLEVSTPGLSRPLTHLHHFERNVGRLLKVKRRDDETTEGRLLDVSDTGITLQGQLPAPKGVKPKPAPPETITFSNIIRAKVEVEFTSLDDQPEGEEA